MVQAAKPQSPVGGKQGAMTEVSSNVWVALVLGVFSAIFAWIWFRGNNERERSEPQNESEQVGVGESAPRQEPRASQQEDGGVAQGKMSAPVPVGAQVQPVGSVHVPGHVLQQESKGVPDHDAAHLHVFENKAQNKKPKSKVILEPVVKAKEKSINPCQTETPQVFCKTENGALSTQKEFDLGKKDSPEPSIIEVTEELIVPQECVYSKPDMPCEDQVVECKHSPNMKTTGAITECQEQEDAFLPHSSGSGNYEAILLPQSRTETEHMDLPVPIGEKCEPVHSPEKIELVRATISDAKLPDTDNTKIKRVAAVQPMSHNIKVDFKVHYITHSDTQWLAVIGNHENLGGWETLVPLESGKDGFWSHSVILPADTSVEWKFVMVENGKIKRWEECCNRSLTTGHDDVEAHELWGYL